VTQTSLIFSPREEWDLGTDGSFLLELQLSKEGVIASGMAYKYATSVTTTLSIVLQKQPFELPLN
jgi:hypothetical protein